MERKKQVNQESINKLYAVVSEGVIQKIERFLLENSMDMRPLNDANENVLHVILNNTNLPEFLKTNLLKFAIANNANINHKNNYGQSPLHIACKYQLYSCVEYLINTGANINDVDNQNKTPLHYAVVGISTECIKPQESMMFDIDKYDRNLAEIHNLIVSTINNKFNYLLTHLSLNINFDFINHLYKSEFHEIIEQYKGNIITIRSLNIGQSKEFIDNLIKIKNKKYIKDLNDKYAEIIKITSLININSEKEEEEDEEEYSKFTTENINTIEIQYMKLIYYVNLWNFTLDEINKDYHKIFTNDYTPIISGSTNKLQVSAVREKIGVKSSTNHDENMIDYYPIIKNIENNYISSKLTDSMILTIDKNILKIQNVLTEFNKNIEEYLEYFKKSIKNYEKENIYTNISISDIKKINDLSKNFLKIYDFTMSEILYSFRPIDPEYDFYKQEIMSNPQICLKTPIIYIYMDDNFDTSNTYKILEFTTEKDEWIKKIKAGYKNEQSANEQSANENIIKIENSTVKNLYNETLFNKKQIFINFAKIKNNLDQQSCIIIKFDKYVYNISDELTDETIDETTDETIDETKDETTDELLVYDLINKIKIMSRYTSDNYIDKYFFYTDLLINSEATTGAAPSYTSVPDSVHDSVPDIFKKYYIQNKTTVLKYSIVNKIFFCINFLKTFEPSAPAILAPASAAIGVPQVMSAPPPAPAPASALLATTGAPVIIAPPLSPKLLLNDTNVALEDIFLKSFGTYLDLLLRNKYFNIIANSDSDSILDIYKIKLYIEYYFKILSHDVLKLFIINIIKTIKNSFFSITNLLTNIMPIAKQSFNEAKIKFAEDKLEEERSKKHSGVLSADEEIAIEAAANETYDQINLSWFANIQRQFFEQYINVDDSKYKNMENIENQQTLQSAKHQSEYYDHTKIDEEQYIDEYEILKYLDNCAYLISDADISSLRNKIFNDIQNPQFENIIDQIKKVYTRLNKNTSKHKREIDKLFSLQKLMEQNMFDVKFKKYYTHDDYNECYCNCPFITNSNMYYNPYSHSYITKTDIFTEFTTTNTSNIKNGNKYGTILTQNIVILKKDTVLYEDIIMHPFGLTINKDEKHFFNNIKIKDKKIAIFNKEYIFDTTFDSVPNSIKADANNKSIFLKKNNDIIIINTIAKTKTEETKIKNEEARVDDAETKVTEARVDDAETKVTEAGVDDAETKVTEARVDDAETKVTEARVDDAETKVTEARVDDAETKVDKPEMIDKNLDYVQIKGKPKKNNRYNIFDVEIKAYEIDVFNDRLKVNINKLVDTQYVFMLDLNHKLILNIPYIYAKNNILYHFVHIEIIDEDMIVYDENHELIYIYYNIYHSIDKTNYVNDKYNVYYKRIASYEKNMKDNAAKIMKEIITIADMLKAYEDPTFMPKINITFDHYKTLLKSKRINFPVGQYKTKAENICKNIKKIFKNCYKYVLFDGDVFDIDIINISKTKYYLQNKKHIQKILEIITIYNNICFQLKIIYENIFNNIFTDATVKNIIDNTQSTNKLFSFALVNFSENIQYLQRQIHSLPKTSKSIYKYNMQYKFFMDSINKCYDDFKNIYDNLSDVKKNLTNLNIDFTSILDEQYNTIEMISFYIVYYTINFLNKQFNYYKTLVHETLKKVPYMTDIDKKYNLSFIKNSYEIIKRQITYENIINNTAKKHNINAALEFIKTNINLDDINNLYNMIEILDLPEHIKNKIDTVVQDPKMHYFSKLYDLKKLLYLLFFSYNNRINNDLSKTYKLTDTILNYTYNTDINKLYGQLYTYYKTIYNTFKKNESNKLYKKLKTFDSETIELNNNMNEQISLYLNYDIEKYETFDISDTTDTTDTTPDTTDTTPDTTLTPVATPVATTAPAPATPATKFKHVKILEHEGKSDQTINGVYNKDIIHNKFLYYDDEKGYFTINNITYNFSENTIPELLKDLFTKYINNIIIYMSNTLCTDTTIKEKFTPLGIETDGRCQFINNYIPKIMKKFIETIYKTSIIKYVDLSDQTYNQFIDVGYSDYVERLMIDSIKKIIPSYKKSEKKHEFNDKIHEMVQFGLKYEQPICLYIDPKLINLFINNPSCNVAKKDNVDKQPLEYAIEILNIEIIKILKNKSNINIKYIDNKIKSFCLTMNDIPKLCSDITNNIILRFIKQYGSVSMPKYTKILLKYVIGLVQHTLNDVIDLADLLQKDDYDEFPSSIETTLKAQYTNEIKLNIHTNREIILKQIISTGINTQLNEEYTILEDYKKYNDKIKRYFETKYSSTDNDLLFNQIINIIKHIVEKIMMVNLYNTLVKLTIKFLASINLKFTKNENNEYVSKIKELVNKIINVNVKTYLFTVLPSKLIKIILKIYDDKFEEDDLKKVKIDNLFLSLTELLKDNFNKSEIIDTNKFEEKLKTYVYPYYSGYFETMIKEMKSTTDMFLKSIQYNYKLLEIRELLS